MKNIFSVSRQHESSAVRLIAIRQRARRVCMFGIRSVHRTLARLPESEAWALVGGENRAQRGRCVWSGIIYYMGCNYNISTDQY